MTVTETMEAALDSEPSFTTRLKRSSASAVSVGAVMLGVAVFAPSIVAQGPPTCVHS